MGFWCLQFRKKTRNGIARIMFHVHWISSSICLRGVFNILGAFAKLWKRLLASSCLSVCPHGTTRLPLDRIFMKNLVFEGFFRKSVEKNQVLLKKSDKNNGDFTWRLMNIYDNISGNFTRRLIHSYDNINGTSREDWYTFMIISVGTSREDWYTVMIISMGLHAKTDTQLW